MTDDERFEQILKGAAADYEAPRGDVPREAMWEAIRARRAATPAATPVATPTIPVIVPRHTASIWMWMGMAATLLLGVAVGRFAWQRGAPPEVANAVPATTTPSVGDRPVPLLDGADTVRVAPVTTRPAARPRTVDSRTLPGVGNTTYSLVAVRHLADVEALLTSYAASPADARSDFLIGSWAKSLLSTTRLLLDSPAARDPVRARLLADLEVILVQLVQHSPGGDVEERSAVERTLKKNQLIPRLRSAVPASLHSGTD